MNKKLSLAFLTIVVGYLLTNCGPSAKEFEEKAISDSIKDADSLAMVLSNKLNLNTRTSDDKKFIKTAEAKFLVNNVRVASEKIEDLATKYSGYLTYSNLRNHENNYSRIEISKDSVLFAKEIIVENHIVLRMPNESLDSLVRELNKLILFLDYRIVKMDDISFNFLANQKASERLRNFDLRQKRHIENKESKLRETTTAEESILNRQNQADYLQVENLALADQVKYCTLIIYIYQKPVLYKQTQVLLNTDSFRTNLFRRILDALLDGWIIFEYFIVFLFYCSALL